jgi:hypothetical protein
VQSMQLRRSANRVWEGLQRPQAPLLILIALAILGVTGMALPQIAISPNESAAYARRLAQLRPSLGGATSPLASLGLLNIRSSAPQRLVLAVLSLVLAANLGAILEHKQEQTTARELTWRLLILTGGLLVLSGWGGQLLWGWREPDVIAWPGAQISLPQRDLVTPQPSGPLGVWAGGYGIYVLPRGERMGLEVVAQRSEGAPLLLLPSVDERPQAELRLAFTAEQPERFFAIQEADLIVRLNQVDDAIQAQVYRSASGELLTEAELTDAEAATVLSVNGTEIHVTPVLLPLYDVVYNPGAAVEALGYLLAVSGAAVGLAGSRASADENADPEEAVEAANPK